MSLRRKVLLLIVAAWSLVGVARVPAQESAKPAKPLDVSYITDDFFTALVVHPARLIASPGLKGLPLDEFSKAVKEQIGIEPSQVEQVILLVPREFSGSRVIRRGEAPPPMPMGFAGIVRFREAVATKELLARAGKALGYGELEPVARGGKTYWKATGGTDVAAYAPDERTLVFANERRLNAMVFNLAPGGRFVGMLRKADASADVLVVMDPSAIREHLATLSSEFDHGHGGPDALIGGLILQVLRRVESYTFSADFSQGSRLRWEITATSPDDAELLHDLIRGWQATLKLALPTLLNAMRDDGAAGIEAEIQAIAGRVLTEVLSGIKTSRTDDRVVMQLEPKSNHAELLTLAAKAVAAARQEGPIVQSTNNLRQLALAMHVYQDIFGTLPSHANYSEAAKEEDKAAAKPLLSWRVHVLPYLEMSELHRQFRFNEPWDSDHNKKLIAKMPTVFKSPGLDLGEGKTCYLVPVGNDPRYGTMFPVGPTSANRGATARGLSLAHVRDGTSNTLMILEVPPEKAVVWTKPDDWEVNVKDAKKGLFGARRGFLLAALGDGSVQRISEKAPTEALLRLLSRADGEVINHEEVILGYRSGKRHGAHDHVGEAVKSIDFKSRPTKAAKKPVFDEPKPSKAEPPKDSAPKSSAVPLDRKE